MPVHNDETVVTPLCLSLRMSPKEWEALTWWLSIGQTAPPSRDSINHILNEVAREAVLEHITRCKHIYEDHRKLRPE